LFFNIFKTYTNILNNLEKPIKNMENISLNLIMQYIRLRIESKLELTDFIKILEISLDNYLNRFGNDKDGDLKNNLDVIESIYEDTSLEKHFQVIDSLVLKIMSGKFDDE
jgi:hypothetical protein